MNEQIDDRLKEQFQGWVEYVVAKCYKRGILSKARTRWKLVNYWNDSRWTNGGIPGSVKETLGEEEATRYFQEVAEDILSDRARLEKALKEL